MDDFAVADRSDEMIFEATRAVRINRSTVVLRQLKSSQAKRRGRRALEVLKKLARRQMMYDSYALQVHGYITSENATEEDNGPFILVHGEPKNISWCLWNVFPSGSKELFQDFDTAKHSIRVEEGSYNQQARKQG
ncbi:hypothetical protein EJB05_19553, partial [Eragrostis curvula]